MNNLESFTNKIFQYIDNEYGNHILMKTKEDRHKSIIKKIIESACNQNDTIEHAANKVVAMLRINP